MRRLYFKPMLWLSIFSALSFGLLIALGAWQYQRLQWKTALLAEVEASVNAPPLTSLAELERAITASAPVDFRRISFRAAPVSGAQSYHVFKSQTGGIFWDVFVPLEARGRQVFAKARTLDNAAKAQAPSEVQSADAQLWAGYVRADHEMGNIEQRVKSAPNPADNRWFKFNQDGSWGQGLPANVRLTHYIDIAAGVVDADALPIRRPSIANNHRDYMLTWWSFALILLVIYSLLHMRAGRLGLRKDV